MTLAQLVLKSSVIAIEEAEVAFEETMTRLERYDARLARVEAMRAKRRRWAAQVAFLKAVSKNHEEKQNVETKEEEDYSVVEEDLEGDAVAAGRAAELAAAEESLRYARSLLAGEEKDEEPAPPPASNDVSYILWDLLFKKDDVYDDSVEEAAGWLITSEKRRWFVLRTSERVGPFLEIFSDPGVAVPLSRIILHGCQVESVAETDDEDTFNFTISHPHQRTKKISCVNRQTRIQWVSVISQLIREHAQSERLADAQYRNELIKQNPDADAIHAVQAKLARRSSTRRLEVLDARRQHD